MNACDTHFHVFGAEERYPYSSDLRYTPPNAPLEDYLEHARELGIERYVFVQPSAYGRDNRCMLTRCASSVRQAAAASSTSKRTPR